MTDWCIWFVLDLGEKKFIKVIGQKKFDTLNSDYQRLNPGKNFPKYKKIMKTFGNYKN